MCPLFYLVKFAIGSSSKNARFILEKVQLIDAFDEISDGNNITKSKPDPEVFVKAREYLKDVLANCIVVEDAYAGIDDASAYEKADYKIKSFHEILDII